MKFFLMFLMKSPMDLFWDHYSFFFIFEINYVILKDSCIENFWYAVEHKKNYSSQVIRILLKTLLTIFLMTSLFLTKSLFFSFIFLLVTCYWNKIKVKSWNEEAKSYKEKILYPSFHRKLGGFRKLEYKGIAVNAPLYSNIN